MDNSAEHTETDPIGQPVVALAPPSPESLSATEIKSS